MIRIDMEMPDNCYCCILCRHADMFCRRLGKFLDRDDCYDERDRNCPLHEVTADEDTISRQDARMCLTGDVTNMSIEQYIKMVDKRLEQLPPSPSRPQEHEKSCEGCEWEDSESDGCYHCARHYADFYYKKRNGGAV